MALHGVADNPALFCMRSQILFDRVKLGGLMQTIVKAIRGKQVFWAIGFMTSASLFLEEKVSPSRYQCCRSSSLYSSIVEVPDKKLIE